MLKSIFFYIMWFVIVGACLILKLCYLLSYEFGITRAFTHFVECYRIKLKRDDACDCSACMWNKNKEKITYNFT